jgi:hypothetical protein
VFRCLTAAPTRHILPAKAGRQGWLRYSGKELISEGQSQSQKVAHRANGRKFTVRTWSLKFLSAGVNATINPLQSITYVRLTAHHGILLNVAQTPSVSACACLVRLPRSPCMRMGFARQRFQAGRRTPRSVPQQQHSLVDELGAWSYPSCHVARVVSEHARPARRGGARYPFPIAEIDTGGLHSCSSCPRSKLLACRQNKACNFAEADARLVRSFAPCF